MGRKEVSPAEHDFRVMQYKVVKEDPVRMSRFVLTHEKLDQTGIGSDKPGYDHYYHQAEFMVKVGAAFAKGILVLLNQRDEANADPYTATAALSDFQRLEGNKQSRILLIFGLLVFSLVVTFSFLQAGASGRGLTGINLQAGWSRTMNSLRPMIRAVIPTDDDGNLVLGVMVVAPVTEAARNTYAYVDSRSRSTYAYADDTVRSFAGNRFGMRSRGSTSGGGDSVSEVQVGESRSQFEEAEMVAA
jgi:hypothetical protein